MAERAADKPIEQVGGSKLTVARADDAARSKMRWDGRVDALAARLREPADHRLAVALTNPPERR